MTKTKVLETKKKAQKVVGKKASLPKNLAKVMGEKTKAKKKDPKASTFKYEPMCEE